MGPCETMAGCIAAEWGQRKEFADTLAAEAPTSSVWPKYFAGFSSPISVPESVPGKYADVVLIALRRTSDAALRLFLQQVVER